MKDKKRFQKDLDLESIINKLIRSWGGEDKMTEMDIIEAWPELMGKGVAYRTTSISIRNKVMYISLNSAVMRDELQYGRSVIIQRVNEFAGREVINDVWLA